MMTRSMTMHSMIKRDGIMYMERVCFLATLVQVNLAYLLSARASICLNARRQAEYYYQVCCVKIPLSPAHRRIGAGIMMDVNILINLMLASSRTAR